MAGLCSLTNWSEGRRDSQNLWIQLEQAAMEVVATRPHMEQATIPAACSTRARVARTRAWRCCMRLPAGIKSLEPQLRPGEDEAAAEDVFSPEHQSLRRVA